MFCVLHSGALDDQRRYNMRYELDIEKAKYDKLNNEFTVMTLKLEAIEQLAEDRKKTIDSLSAQISRYKRKENEKSSKRLIAKLAEI